MLRPIDPQGFSQRGTPFYQQSGHPQNGQYDRGQPHGGYDQPRQPSSGFMGPPANGSRGGPSSYGPSGTIPDGPRSGTGLPPTSSSSADVVPEYDIDAIKARYLGQEAANKKRKLRKTNDKKFVFDWEADDDTAASAHAGALMIGNGVMLGGSRAGLGGGRGVEEGERDPATGKRKEDMYADELERRSAKKSGGDDRHWTEKKLEEMRDRDWRIFREDFSIAARGAYRSLPLPRKRRLTFSFALLGPRVVAQVARSRCPSGTGRSRRSRPASSASSRRSATPSRRRSSGRPSRSACRTAI
jgi:ATP-dependent RNA helicase DDX23/PRP28